MQNAWRAGAGVVVAVTLAVVLRAETIAGAVLAVVVAGLLMVQTPLDLRTRHLSRRVTAIAVALVSVVIAVDVVGGDVGLRAAVVEVGVAAVVVAVYALLHWLSPKSLGLGDVLLVVPLTLAVAHVALHRVLWWQLLASTSGAVHAVWVRKRSGEAGIPFGPHLLVAAWLVVLASV